MRPKKHRYALVGRPTSRGEGAPPFIPLERISGLRLACRGEPMEQIVAQ